MKVDVAVLGSRPGSPYGIRGRRATFEEKHQNPWMQYHYHSLNLCTYLPSNQTKLCYAHVCFPLRNDPCTKAIDVNTTIAFKSIHHSFNAGKKQTNKQNL